MPIKYDYDKDKNIVFSYPSGLIYMSDITEYFNKMVEDPNVESDFIEIANLNEITEFKFSYKEASQLPNLFAEVKNKKNHKGTILIGKHLLHFIIRMRKTEHK